MPTLRFTRDKRGYETTSLVHAGRRNGRSRQRILYWFRTPPGVKVGRPALDEEAIRWIEEHNPDIEFDWPKILEAKPQPAPAPPTDMRRRQVRRPKDSGSRVPGSRVPGSGVPGSRVPSSNVPFPKAHVAEPPLPEPSEPGTLEPEPEPMELEPETGTMELEPEPGTWNLEPEPGTWNPEPEPEPLARAIEQLTHPEAEEQVDSPVLPVVRKLDREQLTRLRARYAELLARIAERGGDPERIEALRAQAESLNPDTWVTDDEVRQGIESFEPKIRDLRAALGLRRRRRSRRGGRRRRAEPARSPEPRESEPGRDPESDKDEG